MSPLIIQARYDIRAFICAQLSGLSDGVRPFRSRPGAASYAPALSDALKGKQHIDVSASAERITRRMIAGHLRTLLLWDTCLAFDGSSTLPYRMHGCGDVCRHSPLYDVDPTGWRWLHSHCIRSMGRRQVACAGHVTCQRWHHP